MRAKAFKQRLLHYEKLRMAEMNAVFLHLNRARELMQQCHDFIQSEMMLSANKVNLRKYKDEVLNADKASSAEQVEECK